MKSISNALKTHISKEVTTLAVCWKLKRRDYTVLGFTNHDKPIVFEGVSYQAASGFTPSSIENSSFLKVDNLDLEGVLSSEVISQADILAGRYDFAEVEIFLVNYEDLEHGRLFLKKGWLGEVSLYKSRFVAEVRGLTQRFSQTIGELYSPSCRAALGDARCKVNLISYTVSGTISSVISNQQCLDNSRIESSGLFTSGVLTFISGANSGLSVEIKEYTYAAGSGGQLLFVLPMPYLISTGDNYNVTQGCDKTLKTCKQKFDNLLNFRGEPHVPGIDRMLETAGTRNA